MQESTVGYVTLSLLLLSLAIVLGVYLWKQKEKDEKRKIAEEKNRERELERAKEKASFEEIIKQLQEKISSLESENRDLSLKLGIEQERVQIKEEERALLQETVKQLQGKIENLEVKNQDLSIKVGNFLSREKFEQEKAIGREQEKVSLQGTIRKLQEKIESLASEKNRLIAQNESYLAREKVKQDSAGEEELERLQIQKKIERLESENRELIVQQGVAKKLYEEAISSRTFYDEFLKRQLNLDLDELAKYQSFYSENYQQIAERKEREELEKNRTRAGKIYEENWGEEVQKVFSEDELDYIELSPQPTSLKGDKADFKLVFRDSKNKENSLNSLKILIELKYSFKDKSSSEGLEQTKLDLKKTLSLAKFSEESYHFIFLITNRHFESREYVKSETLWIVSDREYSYFGLGDTRGEKEPIIAVMSPEASFRWVRMLYILFWNWFPVKRKRAIIEREEEQNLDQRLHDLISEYQKMSYEAELVGTNILEVIRTFLAKLEKEVRKLGRKLQKPEQEWNLIRDKNLALTGKSKILSLGASQIISVEPSEDFIVEADSEADET